MTGKNEQKLNCYEYFTEDMLNPFNVSYPYYWFWGRGGLHNADNLEVLLKNTYTLQISFCIETMFNEFFSQ